MKENENEKKTTVISYLEDAIKIPTRDEETLRGFLYKLERVSERLK